MPESKVNKNFAILREGMKKNRRYIQLLNGKLQQQQQDINNLKTVIGDDNRKRDQNIGEIRHNLALLKSFVTEKLSSHPNDYVHFVNDLSNQPINNSIVPIQGGRRKTRKRKNKRKRTKRVKRKRKRKTRRKKD